MTAVMKSVSPRICEKVANSDCTILVSKTAPKCEEPFKCYIYATRITDKKHCRDEFDVGIWKGNEHVIGEFVCDKVFLLHPYTYDGGNADLRHRKLIQTFEGSSKENEILAATCLTQDEMFDYIGAGNYGYGWHISDLKIYDKPKEVSEFKTPPCEKSEKACGDCKWLVKRNTPNVYECECYVEDGRPITRAPQSYMYVEEL